jgi:hypothetical protein
LVQSARRQVYPGKLLHVFYEGIAVLVTSRETRENEHGGAGVSAESRERVIGCGHGVTISLSDVAVNDPEILRTSEDRFHCVGRRRIVGRNTTRRTDGKVSG